MHSYSYTNSSFIFAKNVEKRTPTIGLKSSEVIELNMLITMSIKSKLGKPYFRSKLKYKIKVILSGPLRFGWKFACLISLTFSLRRNKNLSLASLTLKVMLGQRSGSFKWSKADPHDFAQNQCSDVFWPSDYDENKIKVWQALLKKLLEVKLQGHLGRTPTISAKIGTRNQYLVHITKISKFKVGTACKT